MRKFKRSKSWRSPHKPLKSTWNGDRLMTTKFVGEARKKSKPIIKEGWRGIDRRILIICGNDNGFALPRLPKYVEEFNKREGFSNPKKFTRN